MTNPSTILLSQLSRLDREFPEGAVGRRARGELITDMMTRGIGFTEAAVAFREGERFRNAASTDGWDGPDLAEELDPAADRSDDRLVVPIERNGQVYGRLGVEGDVDGSREIVEAVAGQIALVFDNQRMIREVRQGDFQSKMQLLELESLYDIGLSIASTLNLTELTDEILMRSLSILNARSAALFLRADGTYRLHRAFGEIAADEIEESLSSEALDELTESGKPLTEGAKAIFSACHSAVAVPIRSDRGTIGILAAADRELREGVGEFTQDDIRTLSLFAAQAAIALESARLHSQALEKQTMERELELAAMIQQDILPRERDLVPGLEIELWNRPARQLGGDFYAVFGVEEKATFCVADVSGKSTPAAILVSACHAALQLLMAEGRPLGQIATRLNEHIHSWSAQNKFITLILATIDRAAGRMTYVNAGHNPAFIVGKDGIESIRSHGLPIGLMPGSVYEEIECAFQPGSLLALYSDGITEAESPSEEEYGYDRLTAVLEKNAKGNLVAIREAIVADVEAFTRGEPQLDDQTIVLVRST